MAHLIAVVLCLFSFLMKAILCKGNCELNFLLENIIRKFMNAGRYKQSVGLLL